MLVGGFNPSENISQLGEKMFQTTNQHVYSYFLHLYMLTFMDIWPAMMGV